MQRFHQVVISLFAVGSLAVTACQHNTETRSEPPPDSSMAADQQTQPTSMPTETTPTTTQDESSMGDEAAIKPEPPKQLAANDKRFVETAAMAGMAEVDLGKLALEKAKKQT